MAQGENPIAQLGLVLLIHYFDEGIFPRLDDSGHGGVGFRIQAQGLRLHLPAILEKHGEFPTHSAGHVGGGQDESILAHDDPTARPLAQLNADRGRSGLRQRLLHHRSDLTKILQPFRHPLVVDQRTLCQDRHRSDKQT